MEKNKQQQKIDVKQFVSEINMGYELYKMWNHKIKIENTHTKHIPTYHYIYTIKKNINASMKIVEVTHNMWNKTKQKKEKLISFS